ATPAPGRSPLKPGAFAAELRAPQAGKMAAPRVMPIPRLHGCVPVERAYRATGCGVKWPPSQANASAVLRLRRLRPAFAAMLPRPPPARSLPRHLLPARCSAQALWFDLRTPGLAD